MISCHSGRQTVYTYKQMSESLKYTSETLVQDCETKRG